MSKPTPTGYNIGDWYKSLTPEERSAHSKKAAAACAAANRRYKTQREILRHILTLDVDEPTIADALKALGLDPTFANAMSMSVLRKASSSGDIEAARYVRDTVGEKPTESFNLGLSNTPIKSRDLSKLSDAELEALADAEDADALPSLEAAVLPTPVKKAAKALAE